MSIKTFIKNDLWMVNYLIPHTVKYLEGGKINYIKKAVPVFLKMRVVKGSKPRNMASCSLALMNKIELHMPKNTSFFYWLDENKTLAVPGDVIGNFTLDYSKIIDGSFDLLAKEAIDVEGEYGKYAKIVFDSIHILQERSLDVIRKECTESRKREQLIDEFQNLLKQPAMHFHEGLQRILFFNQYLWQTRHKLNGLGRLDKILDKLFQQDLENHVITQEQAYEYICDFLKILHLWYEYKSSALIGDIGQIIILGGIEKDGTYFSSRLTEMFLDAQAKVRQPDPKVLLRVSTKMPAALLKKAIIALTSKTGSPLFSNDDVIIPCLEQMGIPHEHAVKYCVSACWEPFIPGMSLDQNNIQSFDFFKPLVNVVDSDGVEQIKSFEELLCKYDMELQYEWKKCLSDLDKRKWAKDPFVSMFTDDCNKYGKDIAEGGACFSNYGITTVGMGSVCDSLLNIKKMVFDNAEFSLKEFCKLRKKNYIGHSEVLQQIRNAKKHYAHDEEKTIKLVNHIIACSNQIVREYKNSLNGYAKFGLSSPSYLKYGKKAPADFAGRLSGNPYATHISASDVSYTELVRFAAKLNYSDRCINGNVIDFFITPSLLEEHIEQFLQYMKSAIEMGFFQMQMNVMDSQTLIAAKENPDTYPGLIVRVWGFSAYFRDLPEEYQDLLIERARASEITGN